MNANKKNLFSVEVSCVNDMKYMGTNTTVFFIAAIKRKMIELEEISNNKSISMSIMDIVEMLQIQTILKNMLKESIVAFENAQCKPIISFMRADDWFFIGEHIICMVNQDCEQKSLTAVKCHVANITIIDDELVIFVNIDDGYDFLRREGCYFGIYLADSPHIMKQWEYDFLIKNPEFARSWLHVSKSQDYRNEIAELLF